MASLQPPVVAQRPATADSALRAAATSRDVGGAPIALGRTIAGAAAGSKRKRMGTHVVGPGQAVAVGPVAGAPSTPPVRPVAKMPTIPKQRPKKPTANPPMVKRAPAKKARSRQSMRQPQ
jgi:hypothetical protein